MHLARQHAARDSRAADNGHRRRNDQCNNRQRHTLSRGQTEIIECRKAGQNFDGAGTQTKNLCGTRIRQGQHATEAGGDQRGGRGVPKCELHDSPFAAREPAGVDLGTG